MPSFLFETNAKSLSIVPHWIGKRYIQFELSIFTQFYPPDYAATGQLIEELAIHLERV